MTTASCGESVGESNFLNRWLPRSPALLMLLGINSLVFVALRMLFSFDKEAAAAFFTPLAAHAGVLNFLLGQFIHISVLHFAFNMLALVSFAQLALPRLRESGFALTYLGSGVAGSLAHYLTSDLSAIGASGAVSGIIGFFAKYYERRRFRFLLFFAIPLSMNGRGIMLAFLALNLLGAVVSVSRVSFWSHIGGCLFGIAVAWLCLRQDRRHFM